MSCGFDFGHPLSNIRQRKSKKENSKNNKLLEFWSTYTRSSLYFFSDSYW